MARVVIHTFQPWAYRLAHPAVTGPVQGSSWEEALRHLYDPFNELTRTEHSAMASIMVAAAANRVRAQIWNALVDAGGQPMLDQLAIDALANETSLTTILEGRRWPWNVPLVLMREAYDLMCLDWPQGPKVEILSGWTARDALISVARCGGWRIFIDSDAGEDVAFDPAEARLISYDPERDGMPHALGATPAAGGSAPAHEDDVALRHEDHAFLQPADPGTSAHEDDAPRSSLGFSFTIEDELPPF